TGISPHAQDVLAVGLARLGQPGNAFRHAEAFLGRGLLDDLAPGSATRQRLKELSARLTSLYHQFLPLVPLPSPARPQRSLREQLSQKRRSLAAQIAVLASEVSSHAVLSLDRIQSILRPDAALVLWLDVDKCGEHRACVVRPSGVPTWVSLPGSGRGET